MLVDTPEQVQPEISNKLHLLTILWRASRRNKPIGAETGHFEHSSTQKVLHDEH